MPPHQPDTPDRPERIPFEIGSDADVIVLSGDLDVASATVLRERTAQHRAPDDLVIDLAGIGFTDSSGLSALLVAHFDCEAAGCQLYLRNVPERLRRLLELAGLNDVLHLVP